MGVTEASVGCCWVAGASAVGVEVAGIVGDALEGSMVVVVAVGKLEEKAADGYAVGGSVEGAMVGSSVEGGLVGGKVGVVVIGLCDGDLVGSSVFGVNVNCGAGALVVGSVAKLRESFSSETESTCAIVAETPPLLIIRSISNLNSACTPALSIPTVNAVIEPLTTKQGSEEPSVHSTV